MSQSEADKKYTSKFKFERLRFTPEEMEELTEYCTRRNIPRSVFCKELILKKIYGGIDMKELELKELAKVFVKYNYFSEEQDNYEAYGVLLEIYDCLSEQSKEELLEHYKIQKKHKK